MNSKACARQWLVSTSLLAMASMSQAALIDFNEFAFDAPPAINDLGSSFSSNGFEFEAAFALMVPLPADFRVASRAHVWQADPGFAAILMTDYPVRVTLTRTGGEAFNFNSIDLTDSANVGVDRHIRFTFNFAGGGSSTEDVILDELPGLQTFVFNQNNLSSVQMRGVESFVGEFPWYQFDNVNAAAVPEPASYLFALLGVAAVLRRSRAFGS